MMDDIFGYFPAIRICHQVQMQSNSVGAVFDESASHFLEIPFESCLLSYIAEDHSKMNDFRRRSVVISGIGIVVVHMLSSVISVFAFAMLNRC